MASVASQVSKHDNTDGFDRRWRDLSMRVFISDRKEEIPESGPSTPTRIVPESVSESSLSPLYGDDGEGIESKAIYGDGLGKLNDSFVIRLTVVQYPTQYEENWPEDLLRDHDNLGEVQSGSITMPSR